MAGYMGLGVISSWISSEGVSYFAGGLGERHGRAGGLLDGMGNGIGGCGAADACCIKRKHRQPNEQTSTQLPFA